MESVITLGVLVTLASKVVELLKYFRVKDWNAAFTQIATWLAGVVVIMIGAAADAFEHLIVPGMESPLGTLDFASQVLVGLTSMSALMVVYDYKKALDGGDSAKQPPLFSDSTDHNTPPTP
jgi:uncharacterized membrane protein